MVNPLFLICFIFVASMQLSEGAAAGAYGPTERYGSAMVYDETNNRVILFGGSEWDEDIFYDDTWTYDYKSNIWEKLDTPAPPPARFNPGVAYVEDQQAIIIFGGYKTPDRHLNDMWLFDVMTDTWTELKPLNSPHARGNMGMAYDSENKVLILFGGSSNSEYPYSDTWVYSFESNSWTEMHPAVSPRPQYGVGMMYDSLNKRILLLEGHWVIREQSGRVSDGYGGGLYTYDYSNDTWKRIECQAPSGRYWYSTAYDSEHGRMIIFGGIRWFSGYGNLYDETWIYDSIENTWTRSSYKGPEKRYISPMVYDQANNVTVLFGGADVIGEAPGGGDLRKYYQDTWVLNETLQWNKMASPTAAPSSTSDAEQEGTPSNIPAYPVLSTIIGLVAAFAYLVKKGDRDNLR